jgi:hypothetical protein
MTNDRLSSMGADHQPELGHRVAYPSSRVVSMEEICEMTVVLGVDPGKATGFAVVRVTRDPTAKRRNPDHYAAHFSSFTMTTVTHCTITMNESFTVFDEAIKRIAPEAAVMVACERFTVSRISQATQDTQSLEVIGMLKAAMQKHSLMPALRLQSASDAKHCFNNWALHQAGLVPKGQKLSDHEFDALRHIAFAVFRWVHTRTETYTRIPQIAVRPSHPFQ